MADSIAARGFFLIVYDRRGTPRSSSKKSVYTFDEANKDLRKILKQNKVEKATLMGHSFGGMLALKFAEAYPKMVQRLILVGAPIDFPHAFETIREKCRYHYVHEDSTGLPMMDQLDKMDPKSLPYATTCFGHAMRCGLYEPELRTPESEALMERLKADERAKYMAMSSFAPVQGFFKNEDYTTMNLNDLLQSIPLEIPVWGIYGEQDGLYDWEHLEMIRSKTGKKRFYFVMGASHNVFIDQPGQFLGAVKEICRW